MNNQPVYYLQTDKKWGSIPYQTSKETTDIAESGCGPTSMAMVIATWADASVTPVETCAWSVKHGYKATGNGTYHSYFVPQAKEYGLTCERINTTSVIYLSKSDAAKVHQTAHDYVDEGNIVICLMGKGNWTKSGHYIVWYSNDGDYVMINDPISKKANRVKNTFELLKSEVRFYWVVKVPEEVISMTNSEVKAYIDSAVKTAVSSATAVDSSNTPSSWAKDNWEKATKKGIVDGTRPHQDITREEMATVVSRIVDLDSLPDKT